MFEKFKSWLLNDQLFFGGIIILVAIGSFFLGQASVTKSETILSTLEQNNVEFRSLPAVIPTEMPAAACQWLPDDELRVYSREYERTGFQGGLQWYRCGTSGAFNSELEMFAGRTIDVPSCFIAGKSDWGPYQRGGDPEAGLRKACKQFRGFHLVEGAGHWVQQEQPGEAVRLLLAFIS